MARCRASAPEHFDKTFNTNARGVYFTVQRALPFLKDGASIILTGSGAWQKGFPMYSTYSATKAALRSFVRTWITEFSARGIRANVISPGPIETPMFERQLPNKEANDALKQQLTSIIPLGRVGRPEEVAAAALFLASDESSYITGIDLPVDGGAVARLDRLSGIACVRVTEKPSLRCRPASNYQYLTALGESIDERKPSEYDCGTSCG